MASVWKARVLFLGLVLLTPGVWAEPLEGVEKAEFCERCHGLKGFTSNQNMPRLAGQNKGYLIKQLKNFRKGIRKSTPMRQVTVTLSDEDIEALAEYFSSINVELAAQSVAH